MDVQTLDGEVLKALEPAARRRPRHGRNHDLLVDLEIVGLAAFVLVNALFGALELRGFNRRSGVAALQPRNLITQRLILLM